MVGSVGSPGAAKLFGAQCRLLGGGLSWLSWHELLAGGLTRYFDLLDEVSYLGLQASLHLRHVCVRGGLSESHRDEG